MIPADYFECVNVLLIASPDRSLPMKKSKKDCPPGLRRSPVQIFEEPGCFYPYWPVYTDDEKDRMDVVVREFGCASRAEETRSIPVGSIYVDPRSHASLSKVHDLRIAHVSRVSIALRSINYNPNKKFSGKDLQQLVDETKHRISLQEVQAQLA